MRAQRAARRGAARSQPPCSSRKLITVYQDNRREFVSRLGLELYQSAGGAGGAAAGLESESEEEEEDVFQTATTPGRAAPQQAQQQLALVPVPTQTAAAGPPVRAPMAHLLSLVPPKRLTGGTYPTARSTAWLHTLNPLCRRCCWRWRCARRPSGPSATPCTHARPCVSHGRRGGPAVRGWGQQGFEECLQLAIRQHHGERQHGVASSGADGPLKWQVPIASVTSQAADVHPMP